MGSHKRKKWLIKLTQREFWPMWIYYLPVWLQHVWLALKVRNLFFFLATNPGIKGFILSDSKYETLKLVPAQHRLKSIRIAPGLAFTTVLETMDRSGIGFPVILKPDIGFRGIKVQKAENPEQLKLALENYCIPFLVQEYCDYPLELGIFYFRIPGETSGCIPSITIKEFLHVIGSGRHTLEELVLNNPRALLQHSRLKHKFEKSWHQILPKGQARELESVGNHNLGTAFRDGTALADEKLVSVFDRLSHQMEGFYFGRFDIRAESWEAIRDHNRYMILEVNGVGGEPTHIYDPSISLVRAWTDLCKTWRIAAVIAEKNMSRGIRRPSYAQARQLWDTYTSYRAALFM